MPLVVSFCMRVLPMLNASHESVLAEHALHVMYMLLKAEPACGVMNDQTHKSMVVWHTSLPLGRYSTVAHAHMLHCIIECWHPKSIRIPNRRPLWTVPSTVALPAMHHWFAGDRLPCATHSSSLTTSCTRQVPAHSTLKAQSTVNTSHRYTTS